MDDQDDKPTAPPSLFHDGALGPRGRLVAWLVVAAVAARLLWLLTEAIL